MAQNIAHLFNLRDGFFQVVRWKRLTSVRLVETPILLICVGLLKDSRCDSICSYFVPLHLWPPALFPVICVVSTYFYFHSERRHMSVFSTTHDHLLQGVPFIVATYRTFLLRGLSNGFLFDRTLRMCSCCARSALKGRLDPSSHRPADLRSDRLSFGQFSDKYRLIQQRKRDRLFFCVREIRRHRWQWVAQANVFEG